MYIEKHILKPIPGYKGYYASDTGCVYSRKFGSFKLMKVHIKDGYRCLSLGNRGRKVNRLVGLAWIPNPDNLPIVNHKDGNKLNDHYLNLEWFTYGDNNKHSREVLGNKPYSRPVCQVTKDGKLVARYPSLSAASEAAGISVQSLGAAAGGKSMQSGGFVWVYEENYVEGVGMRKRKSYRPVDKFNLKGKFIARYDSVNEAAASVGLKSASGVTGVCRGKKKACGGHIWKYAEIEEPDDETKDWVTLKEFPFDKISRDGRIYSTHLKRIKKQSNHDGYKSVYVRKATGKGGYVKVHFLVATAYIPNPRKVPIPNHKDGNKSNNTVENLEWNTYSENTIHAHETGLIKTRKPVIQMDLEGNEISRFKSIMEAVKMTKTCEGSLSKVCHGKKETANGFKWKFA